MASSYLAKFRVENVGGPHHNEIWVPAEELDEFNSKIIGKIELIGSYGKIQG